MTVPTSTPVLDGVPTFELPDGLSFACGGDVWQVPPVTVLPGDWVAFVPTGPRAADGDTDPGAALARCLAALVPPRAGAVRLLGRDVAELSYGARVRLRAHVGFVHGAGGLLSARSLRDNLALPLSVHRQLSVPEERAQVERALAEVGLDDVADLRPHDVGGEARWRACVARALLLQPRWVVLEGVGPWSADPDGGGWGRLSTLRGGDPAAVAICLAAPHPAFERWFEAEGGRCVQYDGSPEAPGSGDDEDVAQR